jgi:hypothetical protein
VTVCASSTGTLAFGAIDFACRSPSWFQLPGIDPLNPRIENTPPVIANPNTAHDRHSVYRNISNGAHKSEHSGTRNIEYGI